MIRGLEGSARGGLAAERQQLGDAIDRVRGKAAQYVGEVSEGFDAVELAGLDERVGGGRGAPAAVGTHEEEVLASERHRAQRALGARVCPARAGRLRETGSTGATG